MSADAPSWVDWVHDEDLVNWISEDPSLVRLGHRPGDRARGGTGAGGDPALQEVIGGERGPHRARAPHDLPSCSCSPSCTTTSWLATASR